MIRSIVTYASQGITGIFAALLLYLSWQEYFAKITPIENIYQVGAPAVEDAIVGTDPTIVYYSAPQKTFTAFWEVHIMRLDKETKFVCSGFGNNVYEPREADIARKVSLTWFIGTNCQLAAGRYQLLVNWTIDVSFFQKKTISRVSNVFVVRKLNDKLHP